MAGATVTLTVSQLQDLLQAQNSQFESILEKQMISLQSNLEAMVDDKLQDKFNTAEQELKHFVKDSMMEDDGDLQAIKNHMASMERFISNTASSPTNQEDIEVQLDPQTLKPSVSFPPPPGKVKSSSNNNDNNNQNDNYDKQQQRQINAMHMEKLVTDCCGRMEQLMDQKTDTLLARLTTAATVTGGGRRASGDGSSPTPSRIPIKRSKSTDSPNYSQSAAAAHHAAMRLGNHQIEEIMSKKMRQMEQFIDARHAEMEAYYSSVNDKLHKLIYETVKQNSGITKEELEAVLDARIQDVEDEELQLQQQKNGGIHRHKQEPAESSTQQNEDVSNKTVQQALEKLIQVQQQWIEVQSSTNDLEQQVTEKLELLQQEHNTASPPELLKIVSKLEALEQMVLAALASSSSSTTPSPPKKKRSPSSSGNSKKGSTKTKGLDQLMNESQKKTKEDETSTNLSRAGTDFTASSKGSAAYLGDGSSRKNHNQGDGEDEDEDDDVISDSEKDNAKATSAGRVNKFMNTLGNWKNLKGKQEDVRAPSLLPGTSFDSTDDHIGDIDEEEEDDGDDDIDSDASISVDSSADDEGTAESLHRLESKLDGLEEKVQCLLAAAGSSSGGHHHHQQQQNDSPVSPGTQPIERSTNAKHSRDHRMIQNSSVEELQQMVFAAHEALKSDLQTWMAEQHPEDDLAESGQSGDVSADDSSRRRPNENSNKAVMDPEQLEMLINKLIAVEALVTTNQSLLQEQRRMEVPPVPKELPFQSEVPPQATAELERKILRHLDTMDKSVQFKLDEIFAELQGPASRGRTSKTSGGGSGGELASLSPEDQSAIVQIIKTRLQEIQEAITAQLKESIPDYGNSKSIIGESLEEMRQIVSEVAISEVELLKTQLGISEDAEQEALHAVVVIREQLEEFKDRERRALYASAPPKPAGPAPPTNNLFNFGPLAAKLGIGIAGTQPQQQRQSRNMSIGHNSMSGMSLQSARGGSGSWPNNAHGSSSMRRDPQQKMEDWKNQVASLEDKSSDLRALYSQLRGQEAEEWLENQDKGSEVSPLPPVKSSLKPSGRYSHAEAKEMENEELSM